MYRISKTFSFEASHVLEGLPEGHKCGQLHGHSYKVELVLTAKQLDERGFVIDFGDLASFGCWVKDHLDHAHLNDVVREQPSAENLAGLLWRIASDLLGDRVEAVRVLETAKTWAEYRP